MFPSWTVPVTATVRLRAHPPQAEPPQLGSLRPRSSSCRTALCAETKRAAYAAKRITVALVRWKRAFKGKHRAADRRSRRHNTDLGYLNSETSQIALSPLAERLSDVSLWLMTAMLIPFFFTVRWQDNVRKFEQLSVKKKKSPHLTGGCVCGQNVLFYHGGGDARQNR